MATSGADLDNAYLQKAFSLNQANRGHFGARRAVGEIGCAHSHLNVYREIAGGDADMALVLEDDIDFSGEFKSIFDFINHNQAMVSGLLILFNWVFAIMMATGMRPAASLPGEGSA